MSVKARFLAVLLIVTLLLGSALTLTLDPAAGLENRKARDQGNLRELWHVGLGTTIGELGAMAVGDIDNDGKQELVFGNGQGYLHVLEFSPNRGDNGGFVEQFQSVKLGGPIRGVAMANVDQDPALEIALAVSDVSRGAVVYLFDGATMADGDNWTAGLTFATGASANEVVTKPYGLVFEDVDSDGRVELIMGGDLGHLWVLDTQAPEGEYGNYNVEKLRDEAEWAHSLGDDTGNTEENAFGVAVGKFDNDANFEILGTTKDGDLLVYDGVTHELEFQATVGPNPYGGLGADLDGDGKEEFIVGDDNNLQLYKGGSTHTRVVATTQIREARGLLAVDLYGDSDLELVAVTNRGDIYVLSYDGTSLAVDQSWASGESFRADGGGLAFLPGEGWLLHGGDRGVVRAWEVPSAASHSQLWSTYPTEVPEGGPYSIVGGYAYGNAIGDIDGDGVNELVIGSYEGRVMAFDGVTRVLDWYSDRLEGPVVGLKITDVTGDGEPDLLVGTGDPFFTDGEGSEVIGKLHVFYNWNSGSGDFADHYETSGDIESVWGIDVGELDGSTYPEIALAVAQSRDTGNPNNPVAYEGWLKIYGFTGSTFQEEYSTGDNDYDSLALGVAVGDADNDGDNEVVVGVANNSQGMKGRLYLYDYSGGSYVRSLNYATDNPSPYGLQIVNVDNSSDGSLEIVTGDAENPGADTNGRLSVYYYDGSTMTRKTYKDLGTSAAWGLWAGNLDNDPPGEILVGKANGALLVYEAEQDGSNIRLLREESEVSSLSTDAGFYGGINLANLSGDDRREIGVGSAAYVWVFGLEGDLDKPDLEVRDDQIYFDPEAPKDDQNLKISAIVRNVGTVDIDEWRAIFYDGEPSARTKINEYPSAGQEPGYLEANGGQLNISVTWYADPRLPAGDHNITVVVEDAQSPQKETRESNNQAQAYLFIEEVPNDAPVAVAELSDDAVWVGEPVGLNAGASYDTEDTNGEPDDVNGQADISYRYFPKASGSGWTSWLGQMERTFTFDSPGNKELKVQVRDTGHKLSAELSFTIRVLTNTAPISHLTTNLSNSPQIYKDEFITLDASGSHDPDNRSELKYQFATDDTEGGQAWVSEIGKEGQLVTFSRGGFPLEDDQGLVRKFRITNGAISINYSLEPGENSRLYYPQVRVIEIPPPISNDEPLESPWTAAGNVTITVVKPPNRDPVVVASAMLNEDSTTQTTETLEVEVGKMVDFIPSSSSDPDGDTLTFAWTIQGDPDPHYGSNLDGKFTSLFEKEGTYTVTLTAYDGRGGESVDTVTVTVVKPTPPDDGGVNWGPLTNIADKLGVPEPVVLLIVALPIVLGMAGVAVMRGRAGGEGEYDYGASAAGGVTMLTCPTCASTIEVAASQRPVRVACGGCASEFILRE